MQKNLKTHGLQLHSLRLQNLIVRKPVYKTVTQMVH